MQKDLKLVKTILSKNKISDLVKITEIASGQINKVYDIDNKYIVKIQGDNIGSSHNLFEHQEAVNQKLSNLGAKIPEVINTNSINDKNYLLMKKIGGCTVAQDWFTFSAKQKESIMMQIVEQLKLFHSIEYGEYAIETYQDKFFKNFKEAVIDDINFSCLDKFELETKYVQGVDFLKGFYANNQTLLDNVRKPVFVFSDLHFENILHKEGVITGIIDFDFSCQAPKEYELFIFTDFVYAPADYVEEKLEDSFRGYDMQKEMQWLKKYYPELFAVDDLPDLIRLYSITGIIESIHDCQKGRWSENVLKKSMKRINDLYKTDWLEKTLLS